MERLGGLGGWTEFVEELSPVEGDIARCINVGITVALIPSTI